MRVLDTRLCAHLFNFRLAVESLGLCEHGLEAGIGFGLATRTSNLNEVIRHSERRRRCLEDAP